MSIATRTINRISVRTAWTGTLLVLATASAGCGNGMMLVTPASEVRFVAFGDSTTSGPSARDYPDILRELLSLPPETFANEGAGGETATEGLDRLKDLIDSGVYADAEVFLYWQGGAGLVDFIGLADPFLLFSPLDPDYPLAELLDERLAEIESAVRLSLRAAGRAGWDVYVATYHPFGPDAATCDAIPIDIDAPGRTSRADAYIARLNETLRAAADAEGATLVDIAAWGSALTADPDHYVNCNHLSASGNELVARIFMNFIGPPRER